MSVSVKKIQGVQSVTVTLNNGLVSMELNPGNHLTMAALRRLITANGFSPKEATVIVDGTIGIRNGGPVLSVDGTGETFALIADPSARNVVDDVSQVARDGVSVEVNGRIDPPTGRERLSVYSLRRLP